MALHAYPTLSQTDEDEYVEPVELRRPRGRWLGVAREFLQRHVPGANISGGAARNVPL